MSGSSPRRTTILRNLAAGGLAGLTALGAAACSEQDPGTGETTTVEIVVEDGNATVDGDTPGKTVEVGAGDPVELEVTADQAGEIHIHANPETTLEFSEGTESFTLQIDQPGRVEVETHDPDLLLFQLEVR